MYMVMDIGLEAVTRILAIMSTVFRPYLLFIQKFCNV